MPRTKKIDENQPVSTENMVGPAPEPIEIPLATTVSEAVPAPMVVKKGIKDIDGLTDEQKQVLIDSGLDKILSKMPNSGYTLVKFTASEGYPRNQTGILATSSANLEEFMDFYTLNVGKLTGEQAVRYLVGKIGKQFYTAYPNISVMNLD